jgi:hypothetical protein
MWGKYCKISRICNNKNNKKNSALLKGSTNMRKLTVSIAQDKMKSSI